MNHLFISLPDPDQHVISMLKTKFYNFIWKSKIDRIKRNVWDGGYDNGGLKMLDLTNFIPALKCVWLRRILKSCTDWAHLFDTNYGSEFTRNLADFGDHFLQSNYKKTLTPSGVMSLNHGKELLETVK